jgi:flagellar basal-body rod protein FlgG
MMIVAADQSTRAYQALESVSQNLGNYNTWGYKAIRFDQFIRPDGNMDIVKRTDHSCGATFITRRELDIALNGPGYIQVTRPDGSIAYTRNGSFAKNTQGFIVDNFGNMVGTGIQIPARYDKVVIDPDGTVKLREVPAGDLKEIGHINIVNFTNPEGLKAIGNNLLVATGESGDPQKVKDHHLIQQGYLESSNVSVNSAVEDILRLNAGVIGNLRVIKAVDDIYKEAIQLRQ